MQKIFFVVLLISSGMIAKGQGFNAKLKAELDSIFTEDQQYRNQLSIVFTEKGRDSLAKVYNKAPTEMQLFIFKKLHDADSMNMARIEQIIDQYGYPGKRLVGSPTHQAAFFVIQHSEKIDQYLPIIKKAARKKQLEFDLYAMMLDRSLMYHKKEQIYGTQASGFEWTNPSTGKKEWKTVIWPIKDPERVNERRKKAGFKSIVEENSRRLGVTYEVLTLEEVKKMQGK